MKTRITILIAASFALGACGPDEPGGGGPDDSAGADRYVLSDDGAALLWVRRGAASSDAEIRLLAEHDRDGLSYRLEPSGLAFEPTAGLFVRIPAAQRGGTWLPLGALGDSAETLEPIPAITLGVAGLAGLEQTLTLAPVAHFSQATFIPGAVLVLPFELPRVEGEQWDSQLTVAPNTNSNFTIRAEASGAARLRERVDVGLLFPLGLEPQVVALPLECESEGEGRIEVDIRQESVVVDGKDRSGRAWLSRKVVCVRDPEQASALSVEGDSAFAEAESPMEALDASPTTLSGDVRANLEEMLSAAFEEQKRAFEDKLAAEAVRHRPRLELSCVDCGLGESNQGKLSIESDVRETLVAWRVAGADPGLHVGSVTQEAGPFIHAEDIEIPLSRDRTQIIEFDYVCREPGIHPLQGNIFTGDPLWPSSFLTPTARVTCTAQCTPQDAALTALLHVAEILELPLPEFGCTPLHLMEIVHSAVVRGTQEVARDHTTWIRYGGTWTLFTQLMVDALFNNSDFPCGEGENGLTLCATTGPLSEGEYLVLHGVLHGDVPSEHATDHYQYGFVFDADGDATNNYSPSAEYENDFFRDTDRWYVATYSPGEGWALDVTDASDGAITPTTSNARLILKDNTFVLLVPSAEFATDDLRFRLTAFRHTGDFGLTAPFDWDGSVHPAVADGLTSLP